VEAWLGSHIPQELAYDILSETVKLKFDDPAFRAAYLALPWQVVK